ncbi:unnamed protein product [Bemisia tabaci]|uniref:Uncharacterized protein n=1 Tax=Bemisia tabaci TaxID=7038 RepID=A0A9P0F493_BEMTA|nr:unnamed protein product [Bemisia tabaci]
MGLKTVLLCELVVISTLTVGLMALTAGSSLHCSMRREISPCTCAHLELNPGLIQVTCEKIESFGTIVNALQDKFDPETQIVLKIAFSGMRDFGDRGFEQLGLTIINLKLNYNNLSVPIIESLKHAIYFMVKIGVGLVLSGRHSFNDRDRVAAG